MYTEALPLAASSLIVQYFPGKKKEDVGGQGGDTLEEVMTEDPAEEGPALEGPADDVEVVEVDPVNPAIGWVKEKLRKGALLCVEFCNVAEADGLEEFNPDDDG